MQVSAEIRWFWSGPVIGSDILRWFTDKELHNQLAPGGGVDGESREDFYLADSSQHELGIKQRGQTKASNSKIEVKSLVTADEMAFPDPFGKTVEVWVKQESKALVLDPGQCIYTKKSRWLRKFDFDNKREVPPDDYEGPIEQGKLPKRGCNVEVTGITLKGGVEWTSFGFESFGGLSDIKASLLFGLEEMIKRQVQLPANASSASYPKWLRQLPKTP